MICAFRSAVVFSWQSFMMQSKNTKRNATDINAEAATHINMIASATFWCGVICCLTGIVLKFCDLSQPQLAANLSAHFPAVHAINAAGVRRVRFRKSRILPWPDLSPIPSSHSWRSSGWGCRSGRLAFENHPKTSKNRFFALFSRQLSLFRQESTCFREESTCFREESICFRKGKGLIRKGKGLVVKGEERVPNGSGRFWSPEG